MDCVRSPNEMVRRRSAKMMFSTKNAEKRLLMHMEFRLGVGKPDVPMRVYQILKATTCGNPELQHFQSQLNAHHALTFPEPDQAKVTREKGRGI